MRVALIGGLGALALFGGAWFAGGAHVARGDRPPPFAGATAVEFFLSACKGSADDLSAVARRADEQHWASMRELNASESDPLKVTGMWRVKQNDLSYTVTTGIGPRGSTACQVMFEDRKPRRDDFVAAISKAMTLRAEVDQGSSWRTEIYQIQNLAPKYVTLLFVSDPDGSVYHAAIMGASR